MKDDKTVMAGVGQEEGDDKNISVSPARVTGEDKTVIAQRRRAPVDDKTVIVPKTALPVDDKTVIAQLGHASHDDIKTVVADADEATVFLGVTQAQPLVKTVDEGTLIQALNPQSVVADVNLVDETSTQTLGVGSVIRGRFELVDELGEGGMGSVYRAIDRRKREAEDDNPYIAIKLLSGDFKHHPKAFVTLQRETKKTQALAHPNIITVFDFDREDDVIFMTMEELKGQTLEDLLREGEHKGIKRSVALKVIRGIAAGLAHAHSKGIIHSDLKPGNVFVTATNEVKILDFGIARVVDNQISNDRFDVAELGAMTPRYASIEMIEYKPPSAQDDLYALGIIACELLGGAHPYMRKMATEARDQQLAPNLPKVGFLLRKVLLRAVVLDSSSRTENCAKWLRQLDFASGGYKKWLGAALITVVLVIANAFYIDEMAQPDVALTDLSTTQQVSFKNFMAEAAIALEFEDINGALFSLDKAYQIHAENNQISEFIDALIDYIDILVKQENLSKAQLTEIVATLSAYRAFENERIQQELKNLLD
ncbi:MAG: serine/threonine protein kinase [Oleiphilaceae bacterium]|jgi:serine/threonine protein kinase